MDETSFIDALSHRIPSGLLKKASPMSDLAAKVRQNAVPIAAAVVGGGGLAAIQYSFNRRGPNGLSRGQEETGALHKSLQRRIDQAKAEGREPDFAEDFGHSFATGMKAMTDTFARHPKRGALLVAPLGASLGWGVAKRVAQNLK